MSVKSVLRDILRKLTPTESERQDMQLQVKKIIDVLTTGLKKSYSDFEVQVEGSIAKDTWLSDNRELDIFILLPLETPRKLLKDVINAVKQVISVPWVERYAEHPFLEFSINEYKVEVVPCFKVRNLKKLKSAVDRTPFHTQYVKTHLTPQLRDDVRLLKGFTNGIGVYGAELKVGGFSGYLCELLILAYNGFLNLLQEATSWKYGHVIDSFMRLRKKRSLGPFLRYIARRPLAWSKLIKIARGKGTLDDAIIAFRRAFRLNAAAPIYDDPGLGLDMDLPGDYERLKDYVKKTKM